MFTGVTAGNTAFAESDDLDDILEDYCEFDVDPDTFFVDNPDLADFRDEIIAICELPTKDEREDAIDEFIIDNFPDAIEEDDDVIDSYEDCVEAGFEPTTTSPQECTIEDGTVFTNNEDDDSDLDSEKILVCHINKAKAKTISINSNGLRAHLAHGDYEGPCDGDITNDLLHDEYSNKGPGNLRDRLAMFCDLTAEERTEKLQAMRDDLPDDLRADHLRYCEMSEDEQDSFRDRIMDHMDVMRDHLKDQMHDKMADRPHIDYERFCKLTDAELAASTFDAEFVEKASKWCNMSAEEREDYKREHHDELKDKVHDKMEKFSDKSDRLKAMIMDKRDITDEREDEIRKKFEAKFGEDYDKKRSEIKMKYKDHMLKMKYKMSDERKSDIHDRLAEMKAFKAELREKSSELSDEEKRQLREEFIEKAKDMQLAWISPRTQITAGVDPAEVECREGFSLVMKASNGVPMCLKSDTALRMIPGPTGTSP
jgi:hypothetical protein